MNTADIGYLQSITIHVDNDVIFENLDLNALPIPEQKIREFAYRHLVEQTDRDWSFVDDYTEFGRAKFITHWFTDSQGISAHTTVTFIPHS